MKKILITGASGLVGARLTELLLQKGYAVNTIGRQKLEIRNQKNAVAHFIWNLDKNEIDAKAFEGVVAK